MSPGVVVHFHAGGSRGGPKLAVVWLLGSPLARGLGFLVLVPAGRGVSEGGLFPICLVCGLSGIFFIGL